MLQTTPHEANQTNVSAIDEARTQRIRALNDQFHTGMPQQIQHLGRRLLTASVWQLGAVACFEIMLSVRAFNEFGSDNDPWGEHDFGSFDYKGHTIFWKIDYFDKAEQMASPDPADPAVTTHLLTVLLASDY